MDLDIIRQEIDQIDDQIVRLLEERMHLVEGVVAYKKSTGKPILDTKREEVIFEKVKSRVGNKNTKIQLLRLFQIFSNVHVIIRIKRSNEKRKILPSRNLSSWYAGGNCAFSDFEMVAI